MCGRFSHRLFWAEIHALYNLTLGRPSNLEPRSNVCPTDTIYTVVEHDGGRELVPMRWGAFTRPVHPRMPVILEPESLASWLSGEAGTDLLKPAAADVLRMWPVSRRVNSSRAPGDDPTLIEPAAVG
jgi:putative SOS response-associated peptidase YedK